MSNVNSYLGMVLDYLKNPEKYPEIAKTKKLLGSNPESPKAALKAWQTALDKSVIRYETSVESLQRNPASRYALAQREKAYLDAKNNTQTSGTVEIKVEVLTDIARKEAMVDFERFSRISGDVTYGGEGRAVVSIEGEIQDPASKSVRTGEIATIEKAIVFEAPSSEFPQGRYRSRGTVLKILPGHTLLVNGVPHTGSTHNGVYPLNNGDIIKGPASGTQIIFTDSRESITDPGVPEHLRDTKNLRGKKPLPEFNFNEPPDLIVTQEGVRIVRNENGSATLHQRDGSIKQWTKEEFRLFYEGEPPPETALTETSKPQPQIDKNVRKQNFFGGDWDGFGKEAWRNGKLLGSGLLLTYGIENIFGINLGTWGRGATTLAPAAPALYKGVRALFAKNLSLAKDLGKSPAWAYRQTLGSFTGSFLGAVGIGLGTDFFLRKLGVDPVESSLIGLGSGFIFSIAPLAEGAGILKAVANPQGLLLAAAFLAGYGIGKGLDWLFDGALSDGFMNYVIAPADKYVVTPAIKGIKYAHGASVDYVADEVIPFWVETGRKAKNGVVDTHQDAVDYVADEVIPFWVDTGHKAKNGIVDAHGDAVDYVADEVIPFWHNAGKSGYKKLKSGASYINDHLFTNNAVRSAKHEREFQAWVQSKHEAKIKKQKDYEAKETQAKLSQDLLKENTTAQSVLAKMKEYNQLVQKTGNPLAKDFGTGLQKIVGEYGVQLAGDDAMSYEVSFRENDGTEKVIYWQPGREPQVVKMQKSVFGGYR